MTVPHMSILGQITARCKHFEAQQRDWPDTAPYHNEGYAAAHSLLMDVRTLLDLIQPLLNAAAGDP